MIYWLSNVAEETILQSKYLKEDKNYTHDRPHWYPEFTVEIKETIYLTACVQIDFDYRVVPIEVDELLEKERGCDFRF